jgi:ankyrin repeat protein
MKSLIIVFILGFGIQGFLFANPDYDLLDAVKQKDIKKAEVAINAGANINATDPFNRTALMHSIDQGDIKLIKLILSRSPFLNQKDDGGNTPITLACIKGNKEIVDILIASGADFHLTNKNGETALDISNSLGYTDISRLLENRGLIPKKNYSANLTLILYLSYLVISLLMTIWVARTLFKNGRIFLLDTFENENLADSVNRLLIVGFYLINIGYISLALKIGIKPSNQVEGLEILSSKIGFVLVVLGIMHFFNLFVFAKMRKKKFSNKEATLQR